MTTRTPSYRLHRPSGQAVVTLGGHDFYLGPYGSLESKAEYQRRLGEWLVRGRPADMNAGDGPSINEIMLAYARYVYAYYRGPDGEPTREVQNISRALKPLKELYGMSPARDFGPLALKTVRQHMTDKGLCRGVINQRIGVIKRMFKWASGEELLPATTFHGLLCVTGLHRGRSAAKETEPVKPVPEDVVRRTMPFMCPTLRTMAELQLLTGMRPGELVLMRSVDVDVTGKVWH